MLASLLGLTAAGLASAEARAQQPAATMDAAGLAARRRSMDEMEKRITRNEAAARRALGSMCSGCDTGRAAAGRPSAQQRRARPPRPAKAPDYDRLAPAGEPD
ncbi:MAG: hypothetical protein JWQ36_1828 [Enterovirga sp.]|jgi:hypothetical protein|nr:hypothetical protein [Enterovirga sp.]